MKEMLIRAADHHQRIEPVTREDTEKYGLWHWAIHVEVKKQGADNWYLVAVREEAGLGRFEIPGGHVDWGEEPREAACRELHEELGITVQEDELQEGSQIMNYTLYDDGRLNLEFVFVYTYEWDGDPTALKTNPAEVKLVTWLPSDVIVTIARHHPARCNSAFRRLAERLER